MTAFIAAESSARYRHRSCCEVSSRWAPRDPRHQTPLPEREGQGVGQPRAPRYTTARNRAPTPNPSLAGRGTRMAQPLDEHARPLRAFASSREKSGSRKTREAAKRPGAIPPPPNHPLPCKGRGPSPKRCAGCEGRRWMPAFAGKRLVESGSLTAMSVISLIRTKPAVQQTTPLLTSSLNAKLRK